MNSAQGSKEVGDFQETNDVYREFFPTDLQIARDGPAKPFAKAELVAFSDRHQLDPLGECPRVDQFRLQ